MRNLFGYDFRMEKRTAHYPLTAVKAAIEARQYRFTNTARAGAVALGLDEAGAIAVVAGLQRKNLYKSMTTHANHRIWQDVYHASTPGGDAYIKLTLSDGLLVVSFKEL